MLVRQYVLRSAVILVLVLIWSWKMYGPKYGPKYKFAVTYTADKMEYWTERILNETLTNTVKPRKEIEKSINLAHRERNQLLCKRILNETLTNTIKPRKEIEKSINLAYRERNQLLGKRKTGLNVLTPWLAPIIWDGTYNIDILNKMHENTRIGLFVLAVKKYIQFLGPFLETAERFFMIGHTVTYYAFTDRVSDVVRPKLGSGRTLKLYEVVADSRWQDVSMRRMDVLTTLTKNQLSKEIDYLICADVDMVFNDHVGVEILGDLVATLHPIFFLTEPEHFTYERRPNSTAFIPYGQGDFYYMAAFYGGKVEEIYKLAMTCNNGIKRDKKHNIEAIWQEESHLNRYLVYNKPTKVLSPEYIWDNKLPNGDLIKRKRFVAVFKNHAAIRN